MPKLSIIKNRLKKIVSCFQGLHVTNTEDVVERIFNRASDRTAKHCKFDIDKT